MNKKFMPKFRNQKINDNTVTMFTNLNNKDVKNIVKIFENLNKECRPIWKPMHLQLL